MEKLDLMKQAVISAGEFMKNSEDREHENKSNRKDFVTVADIKSQNILRDFLSSEYPESIILSEEDDEKTRQQMFNSDFTGFVIDPIDGTYNFKRDMKESAISVGYIENGEPIVGVIYDPYRDELYDAIRGRGVALRNGDPIRVSNQETIEGASIATSNSYNDAAMARNLKRHLTIYESSNHMPWTSCLGSGVLIMAWVACGRIDAYHHNAIKPWDNAAAFLLIREAGGVVNTLDGKTAPFISSTVLAGNKAIVDSLKLIFQDIPQELLT